MLQVFFTTRPSIPNVPTTREAAARLAPDGLLFFDSLKSLPTKLGEAPDGEQTPGQQASGPAAPSQAALEAVAGQLRRALGLSLFGFDVVVASSPSCEAQELVVIDVNYLPSYKGAPGAPAFFRAAIAAACAEQQARGRGGSGQAVCE